MGISLSCFAVYEMLSSMGTIMWRQPRFFASWAASPFVVAELNLLGMLTSRTFSAPMASP